MRKEGQIPSCFFKELTQKNIKIYIMKDTRFAYEKDGFLHAKRSFRFNVSAILNGVEVRFTMSGVDAEHAHQGAMEKFGTIQPDPREYAVGLKVR